MPLAGQGIGIDLPPARVFRRAMIKAPGRRQQTRQPVGAAMDRRGVGVVETGKRKVAELWKARSADRLFRPVVTLAETTAASSCRAASRPRGGAGPAAWTCLGGKAVDVGGP